MCWPNSGIKDNDYLICSCLSAIIFFYVISYDPKIRKFVCALSDKKNVFATWDAFHICSTQDQLCAIQRIVSFLLKTIARPFHYHQNFFLNLIGHFKCDWCIGFICRHGKEFCFMRFKKELYWVFFKYFHYILKNEKIEAGFECARKSGIG